MDDRARNLLRLLARHDPDTVRHSIRTANVGARLVRRLGGDAEQVWLCALGALLHDVGKLAVPSSTLVKPAPLDDTEWELMRRHPTIGARMVVAHGLPGAVADVVRCHHERWDGGGYPTGLEGDEIPWLARVVQVADVFEAMVADRRYQPRRSAPAARASLADAAGRQLDPLVVDAFLD